MTLRQIEPSRPKHSVDIRDVVNLIDKLGRTGDRIHRRRASRSVSLQEVHQLMDSMTDAVVRHCTPEEVRRVREEWDQIIIKQDRE